jgi:hypothetical protein
LIGSDRFYEEEGAQGALLFGLNVRATLSIQRDCLRDISQRPECNLSMLFMSAFHKAFVFSGLASVF